MGKTTDIINKLQWAIMQGNNTLALSYLEQLREIERKNEDISTRLVPAIMLDKDDVIRALSESGFYPMPEITPNTLAVIGRNMNEIGISGDGFDALIVSAYERAKNNNRL